MRVPVPVPLAAALLLAEAALAAAGPPGAEAGFTAEEVRRLERHSPVPRLPPDETNKVADDPARVVPGVGLDICALVRISAAVYV